MIGEILNTTLSLNLNLLLEVDLSITIGKSAFPNGPERSIYGVAAATEPAHQSLHMKIGFFLEDRERWLSREGVLTPFGIRDECSTKKKWLSVSFFALPLVWMTEVRSVVVWMIV